MTVESTTVLILKDLCKRKIWNPHQTILGYTWSVESLNALPKSIQYFCLLLQEQAVLLFSEEVQPVWFQSSQEEHSE